MPIKNMPEFDDIETGEEENSKKQKASSGPMPFGDQELDAASLMMGLLGNIDPSLSSVFGSLMGNFGSQTPNKQTPTNSNNNFSSNSIPINFPLLDDDDVDDLLSDEDDDELDPSNFSNMSEDSQTEQKLRNIIDGEQATDDDILMPDNTDTCNSQNDNTKKIQLFSPVMEEIMKRTDTKYSIKVSKFSLSMIKDIFPNLYDEIKEPKFSLSLMDGILPKEILDCYDTCVILDEIITDEAKSFTCAAINTKELSDDNYYVPLYFTFYYDGYSFKTYIHQECNPIDSNGHVLTMQDLFTEESYQKLLSQNENDEPLTNKEKFDMLYQILSQVGFVKEDPSLKMVLIDRTEYPTATIDEIGNFESCKTEYKSDGLFLIGYIELNNNPEVRYFLSDFDLAPEDNKLKVYGLFSNNTDLTKSKIEKITKDFNSSFIEDNIVFRQNVSIEPFYPNSVIIKFNEI